MITFILSFTLYTLTISSKRLLQQQTLGTYGQICMPPASDFQCQMIDQIITDQGSGTLECGIDYSCCMCKSIICGSPASFCDTFKSGGEHSVFGVQDIQIFGQPSTSGAVLDCGAPNACTSASITGSWIDTIQCVGEFACNKVTIDVSQSRGLICGTQSCIDGTFKLNTNLGGEINCGAEQACVNAVIEIGFIQNINCNGDFACQGAKITLISPSEHFHLDCNGPNACENLDLTITIPQPATPCYSPKIIEWKGITCGSNGGCEGMKFTIENNGCDIIRLEELTCGPSRACTGAIFNMNAGNSIQGGVELTNCMCGPSCREATGIDLCYNNIRTLECMDINSCAAQQRTIHNPSNDFLLLCSNIESCFQFNLEIIIGGASNNLVRRFAGFDCGAERSCKEIIVNIKNQQQTSSGEIVPITISDIICSKKESCNGAVFITGDNVNIQRIICSPGACKDCIVKKYETDIGVPCGPDTTTTTTIMPITTAIIMPITTVMPTTTTTIAITAPPFAIEPIPGAIPSGFVANTNAPEPAVIPPAVIPPAVIPPAVIPPA
eukprot:32754_1